MNKMNHEPLKNKRKTIFGEKIKMGKNEGIIFWNLPFTEFDGFEYKNVKSAVEGLKKDISKFRTKNPCFDAWIYSEIMTLIHKWFEDVILNG